MPSNIVLNSASTTGANLLTKQVSHDGDTVQVQGVHLVGISGTEDSYTFANINGDATNGLDVDVTRVGGTVTVDNGGTFAVQVDGDALTALQVIDNAVHVDDAAFTLGTDSGVMMMGFAGTQSVNANDAGAIAIDTDGAVHISDGGNTITVDGTVTANLGATDNAVLDNIQAAVETIDNAISGNEMQVDLVSANVTNAGTFAVQVDGDALTALQTIDNVVQVEDTAHNTGDSGVMALGVRQDSQADFGADGDYVPFSVTADGELRVTTGGGSGGTAEVDDAAFTAATDSGTPVMGFVTSDSVDSGDVGVVAMSTDRRLHTDAQIVGQDSNLTVDLGATDNAVLDQIEVNTSYGDQTGGGTEANALRVTIANNSTGVLSVDDNGNSLTVDGTVTANLSATDNAVLDDIAAHTSDPMTVAHDAAATGASNVNMSGARATNSVEGVTQVANADATRVAADLNGVLLSRPHTTLEECLSERYICSTSASTALSNFDAGGAGIHNYITTISVANGTGTQALIDISDASASANGIMWTLVCPSSGGNNVTFDPPLKQPTANTVMHVKADVSVDAIFVSLNGFQAQG